MKILFDRLNRRWRHTIGNRPLQPRGGEALRLAIVPSILANLARGGRNGQCEGKVVTDAAEAAKIVTDALSNVIGKGVAFL